MPPGQSAWEGHGVQASPEPHAQRAGVVGTRVDDEVEEDEEEDEEDEDAKLERTAEQASGGA